MNIRTIMGRGIMKYCNVRNIILSSTSAFAMIGAQAHAQEAPAQPAAAASAPAQPAGDQAAEEQDPNQLAEIVVTAERRTTNLQTTPIAVSVLGGEDLENKQVNSVLDLTGSLPNVSIGTNTGQANISVRGIGFTTLNPGDDGRVAYYVDGVYISRPSAQLGQFFDVDRVEVLRGPQGTLYGRNATGGAFNVYSRNPTQEASGYLDLTVGNYDLVQAEGALSGPLSDTLSARVAFQTVNRGGYGTNLLTGRPVDNAHTSSVRTKLLWRPGAGTEVTLTGNYHHEDDANYGYHKFGRSFPFVVIKAEDVLGVGPILIRSHDVNGDAESEPRNVRTSYGTTLDVKNELSDALTFRTIAAYEHSQYSMKHDGDGSILPLVISMQREKADQYSVESQLIGEYGSLHFVLGGYYFHEDNSPRNQALFNRLLFNPTGPSQLVQGVTLFTNFHTDAAAVFGQATYDLTDRLSVTVGGRYSYERKKTVGDTLGYDTVTPYPPALPTTPQPGFPRPDRTASFDSFTPKFNIDYKFSDNVFVYASYTQGFKSGGFTFGSLQPGFLPETIKSYEAGIKTRLFDRRVTFNLSAFHYDYTNIQTQIVLSPQIGVFNASAAKIDGIEGELVALVTPGLRLDANASILDAKYQTFMTTDPVRPSLGVLDLSGNRLPQAPTYTANAGVQYTWNIGSGTLMLRGEVRAVGVTYFTPYNTSALKMPAYAMGNAYLTYEDGKHWSANLWVRNVTDKFAWNSMFIEGATAGQQTSGVPLAPRTFGATLGYKF
jgi:iron complex outermembrane receptor protein